MRTDSSRGRIRVCPQRGVRQHVADAVVGEALVEGGVAGVGGDQELVEVVIGIDPTLLGIRCTGNGRDVAEGVAGKRKLVNCHRNLSP